MSVMEIVLNQVISVALLYFGTLGLVWCLVSTLSFPKKFLLFPALFCLAVTIIGGQWMLAFTPGVTE